MIVGILHLLSVATVRVATAARKDVNFRLRGARELVRGGTESLPVLWEDNYLSLLPGETRVVTANYRVRDLGGAPRRVVMTGWNVRRTVDR